MFKRRNPLSFLQNIRQTLWPKMGWWRVGKYYKARIIRLASPAESIAANLAGGAAMSFTPFFGIHIFGGMALAWIFGARISLIATTVGTFVGNPWTFPFLLYASFRTGHFIASLFGFTINDAGFHPDMVEEQADNLFSYFWDNFADIYIPTAIGGTALAIASFFIYYPIFLVLVRAGQKARRLRLGRKRLVEFNETSKGESKE